jgi:hypothetical protein
LKPDYGGKWRRFIFTLPPLFCTVSSRTCAKMKRHIERSVLRWYQLRIQKI